jgi:hypothetical protein
LREIGGIVAIVFGVVLVLPFVRAQLAKRSAPDGAKPVKPADKA